MNVVNALAPRASGERELDLLAHAAICALLDALSQEEQQPFPFLDGYRQQIAGYLPQGEQADSGFWWRQAALEASATEDAAVSRLRESNELSQADVILIMLTLLPERDARFAEVYAALGGMEACRFPCLGLMLRLLETLGVTGGDAHARAQNLLHNGLLEAVVLPGGVAVEAPLRTPALVWAALNGTLLSMPPRAMTVVMREQCLRGRDLNYPPAFLRRLAAVPLAVTASGVACIEVRHDPGADVREVAGAVARSRGSHLLIVDETYGKLDAVLGAAAYLVNAQVLLQRDIAPGETLPQPDLGELGPPPIIAIGRAGGLVLRPDCSKITLDVPFPTYRERLRAWAAALGDVDGDLLNGLAARFQVPLGHVRSIAQGALTEARVRGATGVCVEDALAASRQLNRQQLDVLAEPLAPRGDWSWLVTRDLTRMQLQELSGRCRTRERLHDAVGEAVSSSVGRGVRALFTGPSGTGKTLAARILAQHLGHDIYRVDLGAVVNKYVGETEKNLHKVLSYAESLDVILLLDEGDALLGQRTDVKSANDRYANLETNYLLQRFESYQGIILVTTNLGDNIDRAFKRRMDVVVPFFTPRADERDALWATHLPSDHRISSTYLKHVIARCSLTGGQIRNVVAHAGALALAAGTLIDDLLLSQALVREQQKAGAVFSDAVAPRPDAVGNAQFDEFVSMLQALPGRRLQ